MKRLLEMEAKDDKITTQICFGQAPPRTYRSCLSESSKFTMANHSWRESPITKKTSLSRMPNSKRRAGCARWLGTVTGRTTHNINQCPTFSACTTRHPTNEYIKAQYTRPPDSTLTRQTSHTPSYAHPTAGQSPALRHKHSGLADSWRGMCSTLHY